MFKFDIPCARRRVKGAWPLVLPLVLAACASQGDLQARLKPVAPQTWGLEAPQTGEPGAFVPALGWWRGLSDPALHQLIEQALAGNPGMQMAASRLARAQAGLVYAQAGDLPQVQARAEVDRQRFTEHGIVPPPLAGATYSTGTLQLEGSWEFDLFGRHRDELNAAVGQQQAALADVQAARVLISSQVARAYVQLARLLGQREVAQRALAQRQSVLELTRQRVKAGIDTVVEQHLGEGALPDTRQQIEALDEQITLVRHQLAALTMQPMEALAALKPSLGTLRLSAPPAALPVNLLGQRADVVANLWRVQAAGALADASRTLFYPNLDIGAYVGLNAIGLDRLFKSGSFQAGVMPALDLPLFDGDRLRANLQGKLADQDAAIAAYNQSVIDAIRDAADQLSSARSIEQQRQQQAQALRSAEAAYEVAVQRYKAGLGPYLTVLNAESAVLAQRRLGVDLQGRALDVRISLARALGGHWPSAQ
jgi:NodT family efflux transporter outer membrane factor (OMF) lipoprotein